MRPVPTTSVSSIRSRQKSQAMAADFAVSDYGRLASPISTPVSTTPLPPKAAALLPYLVKSFENVNWLHWLALMIPYCFLYLLIRQPGCLER